MNEGEEGTRRRLEDQDATTNKVARNISEAAGQRRGGVSGADHNPNGPPVPLSVVGRDRGGKKR